LLIPLVGYVHNKTFAVL